jgi:hypothetical protein
MIQKNELLDSKPLNQDAKIIQSRKIQRENN